MKILLTLSFSTFCLFAKAQKSELDTIQSNYQEVVSLDTGFKRSILHDNAKLYFVHAYNSANDVIQYNEPDKVIGKGFFEINEYVSLCPWRWEVYYTTEIAVKDGKYRYTMLDILIKEYAGVKDDHQGDFTISQLYPEMKRFGRKKAMLKLYNRTSAMFKSQAQSLKSAMENKSLANKNDF